MATGLAASRSAAAACATTSSLDGTVVDGAGAIISLPVGS